MSDRLYKLANNAELILTQQSGLGSQLGPVHVASIGQADDVALVSNCPHKLQALLGLALEYAAKYHVTMVEEKTKLLCFSPPGFERVNAYWEIVLPISMSGFCIPFSRGYRPLYSLLKGIQASVFPVKGDTSLCIPF